MQKFTLKDKLEMAEAIFTIIVSIMALWGTVVAWENGFWHKLKHIADHMHSRIEEEERNHTNNMLSDVEAGINTIEKDIKQDNKAKNTPKAP